MIQILDTHNAKGRCLDLLAIDSPPRMHCLEARLKKFLSDEGGNKCAQDDCADQNRILRLVDDVVLQSKQCEIVPNVRPVAMSSVV